MIDCKVKRLSAAALFALLCCVPAPGGAEVFKWRDGQGNTYYADRAQAGAQRLDIAPGFTLAGVKTVYDGDTVQLQDGRKVRLLGINTPEIAHRGNAAEVGGDAAKAWLENFLHGKKVRLQMDAEKQDKYGRVLTYLFTEDGVHVNAEVVKQGLAAVTIHPPNLLYVEPLLAAERQAEGARLGIWSAPDYAVQPVEALHRDNYRGWRRLSGRVASVRRSGKYAYLQFSAAFSARIAQEELPLFGDLDAYNGKEVELRGWLSRREDRYVMPLRHPSAIKLIP